VARLTDEQRQHFRDHGFLLLPRVFTRREVNQMAAESDRLAQWQVAISLALGQPTPRLDVERRGDDVVLHRIHPVLDVSPVFGKYAADDRLLRPLADLLGARPVLVAEGLDCTRVLPGGPDLRAPAPDEPSSSTRFGTDAVGSVVCIDDAVVQVVPGSHGRGRRDGAEPTALHVPAGSVVVLHAGLLHLWPHDAAAGPRRLMLFKHCPDGAAVDARVRKRRAAGQAAEDRYEELVYSGADVPEYRIKG
jgi:hypothetical protein